LGDTYKICKKMTDKANEYLKLVEEGKKMDEEAEIRRKRVEGGLIGHKFVEVIMIVGENSSGVVRTIYELPFDEKLMKQEIKEWKEFQNGTYVKKIEKNIVDGY
jgi:hypothetical protein